VIKFGTALEFIFNFQGDVSTNTIASFDGFTSKEDGVSCEFYKSGVTGLTASQTPVVLGRNALTDAQGNEWLLVEGQVVFYTGVQVFPDPFGSGEIGSYLYDGDTWSEVYTTSNYTVDVDTFVNLAASSPVQTGQRFICRDRANAEYILQSEGYVALAGDVTFANSRVGALQVFDEADALWFGAKYDDSTNDSDAHNLALLRLNQNGGGVLRLSTGITRSNIVNTYDKVSIVGQGRSTIIAPASGTGLQVNGIASGLGSIIHNFTVSGVNGCDTGIFVDGFSRGKFGDLWLIDSLDTALSIDGDGSTEFTFENVYINNPIAHGVKYLRTDGVDTGGVYFDTLHVTGSITSAVGLEVSSTHTSRTRAFMFINKLIIDNRFNEAILLKNVSSFFFSQVWATGNITGKGMLTLQDVKDCFIQQAWLQNSNAGGYNLLISGGGTSLETADLMLGQLRTSGPGTSVQFNGSPAITRCNIGQWTDTATTKTNDATQLSELRDQVLEGGLTVSKKVNLGASFTTLVISSGAITTSSACHRVSPETGTSDDLVTINGGSQGDFLIVMSTSSANTITVKHGTGNIYLKDGVDRVITSSRTKLMLVNFNSEWQEVG
jgi:hypothetical protein